jgi:hypothetical protein
VKGIRRGRLNVCPETFVYPAHVIARRVPGVFRDLVDSIIRVARRGSWAVGQVRPPGDAGLEIVLPEKTEAKRLTKDL